MAVKPLANSQPIIPLKPIDPRDASIRDTFQAKWSRRPACERITSILSLPFYPVKKGYQLFRNILQIAVRPLVYHACSKQFVKKMDGDRLETSRERLRMIGGQTVLLVTEDGGFLEGMYLDIENFRRAITARGGQFLVREDGKYVLRSYEPELTKLLKESFDLVGKEVSCPQLLIEEDYVYEIELPIGEGSAPTGSQKQAMVLTQGNAGLFEMNRAKIMSVLLSGQSCMVFNLRGTGRSHGSPNEERSYRDIEAVAQFLHSKGYEDSQISVQGYCLGSGMAVDLAARRPVHLILDRPFSKIGDVMASVVKGKAEEHLPLSERQKGFLGRAIEIIVPIGANWAVMSYDNGSKIKRVRGSICYILSEKDDVIPEPSRENLKNAVVKKGGTVWGSGEFDHCGSWDPRTEQFFVSHMSDHRLTRRHLPTMPPPRLALHSLVRERRKEECRECAKLASKTAAVSLATAQGGPLIGASVAYLVEGDRLTPALVLYTGLGGGAGGAVIGTSAAHASKRLQRGR